MQLNAIHMRFAAIAGGIVLLAAYTLCGGSWGGESIVQIEFGMDPDFFEGLEVEIDGRVVGRLEKIGQATRSGFEVSRGEHEVRVLHPEYGSQPTRVALEKPGQKARLMLEVAETWDEEAGRSRPVLALY